MKVTLVMVDGSRREVDLRGGLWVNGGGQGLIAVDDEEPPQIICEEREPGSHNVPRIFVRRQRGQPGRNVPGLETGRQQELPLFVEELYTSIPPIR